MCFTFKFKEKSHSFIKNVAPQKVANIKSFAFLQTLINSMTVRMACWRMLPEKQGKWEVANMILRGIRKTYVLYSDTGLPRSLLAHTSPILDNTLLMKVALVNTVPVIAFFGNVDNGFGLGTVK